MQCAARSAPHARSRPRAASQHQLRADPVGRGREQPPVVERMQPRERAEPGGPGRLDRGAKPLHDRVRDGERDARGCVAVRRGGQRTSLRRAAAAIVANLARAGVEADCRGRVSSISRRISRSTADAETAGVAPLCTVAAAHSERREPMSAFVIDPHRRLGTPETWRQMFDQDRPRAREKAVGAAHLPWRRRPEPRLHLPRVRFRRRCKRARRRLLRVGRARPLRRQARAERRPGSSRSIRPRGRSAIRSKRRLPR